MSGGHGGRDPGHRETPSEGSAIDLLLAQGEPATLAAQRQRVANDPEAMLEFADTVALVGRLRELRVEPGPRFAGKLADVVRRAERRLLPAATVGAGAVGCGIAAAVLGFLLLRWWDPCGPAAASTAIAALALPPSPPPAVESPQVEVVDARVAAWQADVATMRKRLDLEASPRVREEFEAGLAEPDGLARWLDPRNALVLMRLDHQLRAQAELRQEALRRQGGLPAMDGRAQQLAAAIGAQLPAALRHAEADVAGVALAVRALIASGPDGDDRGAALHAGVEWLLAKVPATSGAELVAALGGLLEAAAVIDDHHDVVRLHGERLLAEVLRPDTETWARRLPALLGRAVPAAVLGDAGRLLARLPGVGVDAGRCGLVRRLLLGELRGRRDRGDDGPEVVAALLYGNRDLLPAAERDAFELQLQRWRLARLAPDYVLVQQLAWALEPGRRGYARLQAGLRQLAVDPDPQTLAARAAFCLCLATGYAAFDGGALQRLAAGS